jgi:hypothetical protein
MTFVIDGLPANERRRRNSESRTAAFLPGI